MEGLEGAIAVDTPVSFESYFAARQASRPKPKKTDNSFLRLERLYPRANPYSEKDSEFFGCYSQFVCGIVNAELLLQKEHDGNLSDSPEERFDLGQSKNLAHCIVRTQKKVEFANSYFHSMRDFTENYDPAKMPELRRRVESMFTPEVLEGIVNMGAFNNPPKQSGYKGGCKFFKQLLPAIYGEVAKYKHSEEYKAFIKQFAA